MKNLSFFVIVVALLLTACGKEQIELETSADETTVRNVEFIPADQMPADEIPNMEDLRASDGDDRDCCSIESVSNTYMSGDHFHEVNYTPSTDAEFMRIHHFRTDIGWTYIGTTKWYFSFTDCINRTDYYSTEFFAPGDYSSHFIVRTENGNCSNGIWHQWSK